MVELYLGNPLVVLGPAIDSQPTDDPNCTECRGEQERKLPAKSKRDPGHNKRRDRRAGIGARIKDSGGQRALLLRKPFGDGFYRRWKVSRFAESKRKPRHSEAKSAANQRMRSRRQAPN